MGGRKKERDRALLGRFGRYVDYRRQEQNLTFRALATLARMSHSNVYEFSQLRKDPRLSELQKLAQAFGEPLQHFLKPFLDAEDSENEHSSQ